MTTCQSVKRPHQKKKKLKNQKKKAKPQDKSFFKEYFQFWISLFGGLGSLFRGVFELFEFDGLIGLGVMIIAGFIILKCLRVYCSRKKKNKRDGIKVEIDLQKEN